jgi:hypothetical protein
MAQNIILKRSGLAGKVPDTGSLNLGEVAINTYDGKVFFKRSGSVESIQEILTTNSTITGSLSMNGTGSFSSLKVNDTLTVNHGTTIISGSQLVTDELTVLGAINARQFNISVVSSSVIYQSGSTKFGDTLDDTHDFTGSVNITGSFLLNGAEVGGNLPNTYDFNLEQTAAYDFEIETEVEGVVSFVTGDNGNVKIKSNPQTADITINDVTYLSVSTASVIVTKSLLPDISGTIDLGSIDKPFRHLYVGTGSIYLVNPQGTISKQISANTIVTTSDIESGSINLSAALPSGLISSSAQLTSSYDSRYVLSGSITQTTWDNIASKPSGIVSGSSQIDITSTTGYTTFSSSIKTVTDTFATSASIASATSASISDLSSSVKLVTDTFATSASVASATSASISDLSSSVKLVTDTFPTSASVASATSNSISTLSGSVFTNYAKLNADNIFVGTQVITGSLFVSSNLVVQGSSSLQNITASAVSIGTNTVILNTDNPAVRYGGISVVDSGSVAGKSGSLYFDSTDDEWIFVHQGNEAVTSSVMITGPETYNNVGNEINLTDNRVPKIQSGFHIVDSNISDSGVLVTINSATQISGALGITGSLTIDGVDLITNQQTISASAWGAFQSASSYSSSLATSISASNYIITINSASVSSVSSSFNSRIITIEGKTLVSGSSQIDVMSTTNIARLATTGSNTFSAQQTISSSAEGLYISSAGSAQTLRLSSTTNNNTLFRMNNFNNNFYDIQNQPSNNSLVIDYNDTTRLEITSGGTVQPGANGTQDLGSTSLRWGTIYTSDLSLNNGIGDWTIVEGEDDLFLYNNKKGKVYKFALTEVDPNVATPKKS